MGIKSDFNVPFRMTDKEKAIHDKEVRNPDDLIKKADSEKSTGTKVLEAVAKIRGFVRIFDAIRFEPRLSSNKGAESFFDPQTIISAQRDEMKGFEKAANPINRALRKFSEAMEMQKGVEEAIRELKKSLEPFKKDQDSTSEQAPLLPKGILPARINELENILKELDAAETQEEKDREKNNLKKAANRGDFSKSPQNLKSDLLDKQQELNNLKKEIELSEVTLRNVEKRGSELTDIIQLQMNEFQRLHKKAEEAETKLRESLQHIPEFSEMRTRIELLLKTSDALKDLETQLENRDLQPEEQAFIKAQYYLAVQENKLLESGKTQGGITEKIIELQTKIKQDKQVVKDLESSIIKLDRAKADIIIYPGKSLFLRVKYGLWGTTALLVNALQDTISMPFNLAISSRTIVNHAINKYDAMNRTTDSNRALNFGKAGLGALKNVVAISLHPVSNMFSKLGVITGFGDKIYTGKNLTIIEQVGMYLSKVGNDLSPTLTDAQSAEEASKQRDYHVQQVTQQDIETKHS